MLIIIVEYNLIYFTPFAQIHFFTCANIISFLYATTMCKLIVCTASKEKFEAIHVEQIYPLIFIIFDLLITESNLEVYCLLNR